MKIITLLLSTILFLYALSYYYMPVNPVEELQEIGVHLGWENGNEGSGVIKRYNGETYIWTAFHLIRNNELAPIYVGKAFYRNGNLYHEKESVAEVVAGSPYYDLLLLKVTKNDYFNRGARFYTDKKVPSLGDEVWSVACPYGAEGYNTTSHGYYSQYDRKIRIGPLDHISCPVYMGSSGGGVYLNDGRLVGIISMLKGSNNTMIVPVRHMIEWAKSIGMPPELYQ